MKNYEEMSNSVFEKRDAYYAKMNSYRKRFIHYGIPCICLTLVSTLVLVIFSFTPSSLPSYDTSSSVKPTDSTVSSTSDNTSSNDVVSVPDLPEMDSIILVEKPDNIGNTTGSTTSNPDSSYTDDPIDYYFPSFNNYQDFEQWLLTGTYTGEDAQNEYAAKCYYESWAYLWKNADYTLQTGYYYRPDIKNAEQLKLSLIDPYISKDAPTRFYFEFKVNSGFNTSVDAAYHFTLYSNSDWVKNEFTNDLNNATSESPEKTYSKETYNNILYHIFRGNSYSEECDVIGIYWQQNETWYYGYYLAAKDDINGYKEILPNLTMVKTSFR